MFILKTLVKDKLVDNATIKGLFNAAATGSCAVRMAELQLSATYPQILIDYVGGPTTSNMDAEEGVLYLRIESQGSGSEHPLKNLGFFRSAILNVLDDTNHSATATVFHMRKINELGERYDEERKMYFNLIGFNVWVKQSFNNP
jgi:hypothetical protein